MAGGGAIPHRPYLCYDEFMKKHFSVGAVIKDGDRYLLIDRVKPPLGWAGVAGHMDEGEEPLAALKREVKEEVGLEVTSAELLIEEFVEWNECSQGVHGHYWYVYDCQVKGNPQGAKSEVKNFGWYNKNELKHLKLEPVWKHWFEKLGVL